MTKIYFSNIIRTHIFFYLAMFYLIDKNTLYFNFNSVWKIPYGIYELPLCWVYFKNLEHFVFLTQSGESHTCIYTCIWTLFVLTWAFFINIILYILHVIVVLLYTFYAFHQEIYFHVGFNVSNRLIGSL